MLIRDERKIVATTNTFMFLSSITFRMCMATLTEIAEFIETNETFNTVILDAHPFSEETGHGIYPKTSFL